MSEPLTVIELNAAFLYCARFSQQSFFKDIGTLRAGRCVPRGSTLRSLMPFLHEDGTLRVGGRLDAARLTYAEKHPVILPKNSRLAELLIDWAHKTCLHGGHSLTYSCVLKRAWIIGGRQMVRAHLRRCVQCIRTMARPATQSMGSLPKERVHPSRPFSRAGLDYAGPFHIKSAKGRGVRSSKGYLAFFVCLATKAVHLEVVGDLTTASFIAALRRFAGRRGVPAELWSDNATTFHGVDAALRSMFREASIKWQHVADLLVNEGIRWKFIPPSAPYFSGLWEAAVKSAKSHIKRVVGVQLLTYEEFTTLAIQVERAMNSRPLTPLSGDLEDQEILTPGHFLVALPRSSLLSIPEPIDAGSPFQHLRHWQLVQAMYHHFWTRWSRDYLHTLQQRSKWTRSRTNLRKDDLVLILDASLLHGNRWPMGRVTTVHPGPEGLVRVATIKTAYGTYDWPITKLAIIPVGDEA